MPFCSMVKTEIRCIALAWEAYCKNNAFDQFDLVGICFDTHCWKVSTATTPDIL